MPYKKNIHLLTFFHIKFVVYALPIIITFLLLPLKNTAQHFDSLLVIWNTPDAKPLTKMKALTELLDSERFCVENVETAYSLAQAQFRLAKTANLENYIDDAYFNRIKIAVIAEQYYEAIDIANECLNSSILNLNEVDLIKIKLKKGISLHKIGQSEEAMKIFKSIIQQENVPKKLLADAQNDLGLVYYRLGDYTKAIDVYQQFFETVKDFDNVDCKIASYYNNTGNIHYALGELSTALRNYEASIASQKKCGGERLLITKLANIAKINFKHKNYDEALKFYENSLNLAKKYRNKALILDNQTEIANIFVEKNENPKAEILFSSLEKMIPEVEDYEAIAYYYYSYGTYNLDKQSFQQAYTACEKGFKFCEQSKHSFGMKVCAQCLLKVSEKREDWKSSLHWQKQITSLNNTINNAKSIKKAARLEAEAEYKEKQASYEKNLLALELEKEKAASDRLSLTLFSVVAVIIGLSLLWVYFSEKKKGGLLKKQNAILAENLKNKELIEQQATKLQEQEKLKSDFIANIAHEFQTPLTIINGQANILLTEEKFPRKVKQTVEAISRNSSNLSHLTSQILEVAKNQDWKLQINISEFLLYELLNPIFKEYQILAIDKQLDIQFNYNGTEELSLKTDAYKLKIIIINLLSNAIRYSKTAGTISVNCRRIEENLEVEVKDNGIGISAQDLPNIFNRFYQARQTNGAVQQKGGIGVGLAICKEYAMMLQGKLTAKSKENRGSIFTFLVPTVLEGNFPADNRKALKPFLNRPQIPANIPDTVQICKNTETILVVEDNKDIWFFLQNIFKEKYNLIFKSNGLEALSFLESAPTPCLIITDVMMPHMDGISLIKALKKDVQYNRIPLMVLTARNDLGGTIKELRLNIDDYIIKPFDNTVFTARVEYLLNLAKEQKQELEQEKILLDKKNQAWLEEVEQYIVDSLDDFDLAPPKIAGTMDLSEVHLNRKLKALTGFTASKYILEARFRKSFELLEKKEVLSVKAACYAVGFKAPKYFAKNFKKRFGKAPSDLLK